MQPNRSKSLLGAGQHAPHSDELCARAIAVSYRVLARKCNYRPKRGYRAIWRNLVGGLQFPRRGNLILNTTCQRRGPIPNPRLPNPSTFSPGAPRPPTPQPGH